MRAIVIKPFVGAKDGETYPTAFAKGDVVEGNLGDVAIAEKWAEPKPDPKPAPNANK